MPSTGAPKTHTKKQMYIDTKTIITAHCTVYSKEHGSDLRVGGFYCQEGEGGDIV